MKSEETVCIIHFIQNFNPILLYESKWWASLGTVMIEDMLDSFTFQITHSDMLHELKYIT